MSWARIENRETLLRLFERKHAAGVALPKNGTPANRREYALARSEFCELQRRIVSEFAAERGWQGGKWFSLPRLALGLPGRSRADFQWNAFQEVQRANLAWDHPDYFRETYRPYRAAGVVVHTYNLNPDPDFSAARELAALHGLEFEPLAWSWYWPGGTGAGIYHRAETPIARCA